MANEVRGEADADVGKTTVTIVVTMDSLAQLSAATGYPTLQELCDRLIRNELFTTRAALGLFVMKGRAADGRSLNRKAAVAAALAAHSFGDTESLSAGFAKALAALFPEDGGNAEGEADSAQGKPTTS